MNYPYKNYKLGVKKQEAAIPSYGWRRIVNDEVLSNDNQRDVILDVPLMDLKNLSKDVENYMEELQEDLENPVKIKFLQKDLILKYISYLEDFEDELEQFQKDHSINPENTKFQYNKSDLEKEEILNKINKIVSNGEEKEKDKNQYLTNQIQMFQKKMYLKELEKLEDKLEQISCIVGNEQAFQKDSLYEQFQQLYHEVDSMNKDEINNVEKKLVLIVDELKRLTNDIPEEEQDKEKEKLKIQEAMRMRNELNDLYEKINFKPKQFQSFYQANELVDIKNYLINYQYFINKACQQIIEKEQFLIEFQRLEKMTDENNKFLNEINQNINEAINQLQCKFYYYYF